MHALMSHRSVQPQPRNNDETGLPNNSEAGAFDISARGSLKRHISIERIGAFWGVHPEDHFPNVAPRGCWSSDT